MLIKLNDKGLRVYMGSCLFRKQLAWQTRIGKIERYNRDRSLAYVVWNGTNYHDRVPVNLIEPAERGTGLPASDQRSFA